MKVAIYTRVSTAEQAAGSSLPAQEARCRAWAVGKGAEVVEVYRDDGFSAATTKRPAYQRMLHDLRAGRFDMIVALRVDRLSRSSRDFYNLLALAEEFGVGIVAVEQDVDTSTPAGRLMRGMLLEFAQFEREMTADRIRETMLHRAQRGLWNGGRVPLGYRVEDKRLVVDEKRAPLVREMYRLYAAGQSTNRIAAVLRDRGYDVGRHGILTVLRSPVYRGRMLWSGKVYPGHHPAIVDDRASAPGAERQAPGPSRDREAVLHVSARWPPAMRPVRPAYDHLARARTIADLLLLPLHRRGARPRVQAASHQRGSPRPGGRR